MPWDDDIDWFPTPVETPSEEFLDLGDNEWHGGSESGLTDSSGIDWGAALGGGGGNGLEWLTGIGKALGLTNRKGELDLMGIISLAAMLGNGFSQQDAIKSASGQMQASAEKANQLATDAIRGAQASYAPYQALGASALEKMAAYKPESLAAKYATHGTPVSLGDKYRPLLTLANLGKR